MSEENDWIEIKIDNIGRSLSPYQRGVLVEEATKAMQIKVRGVKMEVYYAVTEFSKIQNKGLLFTSEDGTKYYTDSHGNITKEASSLCGIPAGF